MRKIFVLLTVVLLVGLMVVPAFAVGGSGSSGEVWYPIFSFDTVEWDCSNPKGTYSMPFPFSSGMVGFISDYSFYEDLVHGHQGMGEDPDSVFPRIVGTMNNSLASPSVGENQSITFKGGHQVIRGADFSGGGFSIDYNPDDIRIINTVFKASYYTVIPNPSSPDTYRAELKTFTWTEAYYPDNIIDFTYPVRKLVEAVGANSGGNVFIYDCSFTINFTRKTVATTSFGFLIDTNGATAPGRPSDFGNWFNLSKIPVSNVEISMEDVDLLSWAIESAESFLQTEIFPGFSLDKLFVIILVIGVMLWFIKLCI